ncbi:Phosphoribosyltransferase Domain-Containing Protein 1 [Manis pentadactyla]|nr:Phosphoribosyltransferase Domain-Containing Protein 1 [Manis pentadactyla]
MVYVLSNTNSHSMDEMQIIGGDDLSSLAGKEFICTQPLVLSTHSQLSPSLLPPSASVATAANPSCCRKLDVIGFHQDPTLAKKEHTPEISP